MKSRELADAGICTWKGRKTAGTSTKGNAKDEFVVRLIRQATESGREVQCAGKTRQTHSTQRILIGRVRIEEYKLVIMLGRERKGEESGNMMNKKELMEKVSS